MDARSRSGRRWAVAFGSAALVLAALGGIRVLQLRSDPDVSFLASEAGSQWIQLDTDFSDAGALAAHRGRVPPPSVRHRGDDRGGVAHRPRDEARGGRSRRKAALPDGERGGTVEAPASRSGSVPRRARSPRTDPAGLQSERPRGGAGLQRRTRPPNGTRLGGIARREGLDSGAARLPREAHGDLPPVSRASGRAAAGAAVAPSRVRGRLRLDLLERSRSGGAPPTPARAAHAWSSPLGAALVVDGARREQHDRDPRVRRFRFDGAFPIHPLRGDEPIAAAGDSRLADVPGASLLRDQRAHSRALRGFDGSVDSHQAPANRSHAVWPGSDRDPLSGGADGFPGATRPSDRRHGRRRPVADAHLHVSGDRERTAGRLPDFARHPHGALSAHGRGPGSAAGSSSPGSGSYGGWRSSRR